MSIITDHSLGCVECGGTCRGLGNCFDSFATIPASVINAGQSAIMDWGARLAACQKAEAAAAAANVPITTAAIITSLPTVVPPLPPATSTTVVNTTGITAPPVNGTTPVVTSSLQDITNILVPDVLTAEHYGLPLYAWIGIAGLALFGFTRGKG